MIPASLHMCTARLACSKVIPLRMRLSISGFPDSMPKLTQSHPACRMASAISRSMVFTREKAVQPKRSPLFWISRQTSRTLFFLEVNPADKTLLWVRAGHEPALFFDCQAMKFSELNGRGMALGIDEAYRYESFSQTGWNAGDIILIGTDGIHETHNEADDMYGQLRLREIVRKHADQSSASIQNAIIESLRDYRKQASQEDDITLVVIKLL